MPRSRWRQGHSDRRPAPTARILLFQMIGDELGHFKHGHLCFAAENSFQLVIGIDHAAVGRILQVELLDVIPDFFGHFGTRQWCCANHCGQNCGRCHRFHESGVWLAWNCRCSRFFHCRFCRRRRFCWCCLLHCRRWFCRRRCCCWCCCCWGFFGCCHLRASLTNTWEIAQLIARLILVGFYRVCKCFSRFHSENRPNSRPACATAPLRGVAA